MTKSDTQLPCLKRVKTIFARRIIGAVVLFLWALGGSRLAAAERPEDDSYLARAWRAEDGLPENRVVGIVQIADGFLWVLTQGGLVCFDGVHFAPPFSEMAAETSIGTMRIMILDREGRIWVAKEGGVLIGYDGSQVRVVTPKNGLPKNDTQISLAEDATGGIWVSYETGKVIRLDQNDRVDSFTSKDGLPADGVCWLASDLDGKLWFAKGRQVGVFHDGRFESLQTMESPALRIAVARSGGIWICTGGRVLKLTDDGKLSEFSSYSSDKINNPGFEPSVVLEDRKGNVWVGTVSAGLFCCQSNAAVRVEVSNPEILSLAEDREGNLWVGTRGGGLNRVQRRVTSLIGVAEGLPFKGVQSVCKDATGSLWVVGDNGLLARRQGTNWMVQGSTQDYFDCVAADALGSVWIGARNGLLYHWQDGQFNLVCKDAFQGKPVRSLLVAKNNDLWIGTYSSDTIYRLRGEKLKKFHLKSGFRFIRAMTEDAFGNIWIGGSDGLLVRVTGDVMLDETPQSLMSIRCLYGETNGDLWIGYGGFGVGRLRSNGQFFRFNNDQGMPNNYVSQIQDDGCGDLWLAGNQGIFEVREREFDDVADGRAARIWPRIYGSNEGMSGLQGSFDFNPASTHATDNRLYFSMLTGLAEVRLDQIQVNHFPPVVEIEQVTANDQTYIVSKNRVGHVFKKFMGSTRVGAQIEEGQFQLPPGLQHVQFQFSALSFTAPENVQFRYQLEGLDQGWVDAGTRRVADYTYPPPGHYRFRVIACNNDGIWNENGDAGQVTFEPFFWTTLWFKLLATFTTLTVLSGLVVLVLRRTHKLQIERLEQQRKIELERSRIAQDLHDELGVGLTEIGLLGDLAGTSTMLPETRFEYLHEITVSARNLVASLDEIVWAINPGNDTSQSVSGYFSRYAQTLLQRAAIGCRLDVIGPQSNYALGAETRHQLFLTFKEALNNAIRHSGATEVQVSFRMVDGNLVIRLMDNGRGFTTTEEEGRNGLAGMNKRLQKLGGRCEVISFAGGGTSVTLILPMKHEKKV